MTKNMVSDLRGLAMELRDSWPDDALLCTRASDEIERLTQQVEFWKTSAKMARDGFGTAIEPGAGPMPWNPETSTNISIHEQTPEKPSGVREPIFGEVGCAHCGAPYATAHNPGCVLYMASEKSSDG